QEEGSQEGRQEAGQEEGSQEGCQEAGRQEEGCQEACGQEGREEEGGAQARRQEAGADAGRPGCPGAVRHQASTAVELDSLPVLPRRGGRLSKGTQTPAPRRRSLYGAGLSAGAGSAG